MENETQILINRTELAVERAETAGFHETAQALKVIAATLRTLSVTSSDRISLLQNSHQ